jgi:Zn-finger nucleic acid-binding protein
MNFTGRMEGQEIQVELKYCERCGGLWLRPQRTDGVFCASCRLCLAARPDPGEATCSDRARRKARRLRRSPQSEGRIEKLLGVAVMEVQI